MFSISRYVLYSVLQCFINLLLHNIMNFSSCRKYWGRGGGGGERYIYHPNIFMGATASPSPPPPDRHLCTAQYAQWKKRPYRFGSPLFFYACAMCHSDLYHWTWWARFGWEPEGRYRHRLWTAIVPFWFSTEHFETAFTPFWLSTDE